MSFHDDLQDLMSFAKAVISDQKEEKLKAEQERRSFQMICPYCGATSKFVWEEGKQLQCPNCGANYDPDDEQLKKLREERDMNIQAERKVYEQKAIQAAKTKSRIRLFIIVGILLVVLMVGAVIAAKISGGSLHFGGDAVFDFHLDSGKP